MALTYTTIQHGFRKAHGLSLNEYAICDIIYLLSTNPDSKIKGWCYMSKAKLAEEMGLGKRTVEMILNRMIDSGYLEKEPETSYLKTTSKWNKVYFIHSAESAHSAQKLHQHSAETAHIDSAESAHYNNKIDNNTDKEAEASLFVSLLEQSKEIFSEAGLQGVFFQKVKSLNCLSDVEVNSYHDAWKKKNQALGTDFKSKDHLKRSFNRFIAEAKGSGGKTGLPINPTQPRKIKFTGKLI